MQIQSGEQWIQDAAGLSADLEGESFGATEVRKYKSTQSRPREDRDERGAPSGGGGYSGGGGGGGSSGDVKLYVGNLSFDTAQESLCLLFEEYGSVSDVFMPIFRDSGKPRGFVFVSMSRRDADKAVQEVNGREFDGRVLRVNEAMPKEPREGGGGRGGGAGGYRVVVTAEVAGIMVAAVEEDMEEEVVAVDMEADTMIEAEEGGDTVKEEVVDTAML